jgi:hypothetical protein
VYDGIIMVKEAEKMERFGRCAVCGKEALLNSQHVCEACNAHGDEGIVVLHHRCGHLVDVEIGRECTGMNTTPLKDFESCRETINKYAFEVLPLFADAWSRFPQGEAAEKIVQILAGKVDMFRKMIPNAADELTDTIKAINYHREH